MFNSSSEKKKSFFIFTSALLSEQPYFKPDPPLHGYPGALYWFWWPLETHRIQGLCQELLQAISSLFSLIPPHWEICLLSAQILSTQEVAPCQWSCLLCGELATHFGSELRVIYLKCEHLSEAADGGNRVELPEPRAGSISFKCKVHTI